MELRRYTTNVYIYLRLRVIAIDMDTLWLRLQYAHCSIPPVPRRERNVKMTTLS
jgi:hypothetical protein